MAKIYAPPTEIGPAPEWRYNSPHEENRAAEAAYTERVIAYAKRHFPHDALAGTPYSYPVADGYASYIVLTSKPLSLIHLPHGDAYNMPRIAARGLRVSDIKEYARREAAWKALAEKNRFAAGPPPNSEL